eukprot:COSAG01_NODE_2160_length_8268_cov_230.522830_4_plen_70_part_00
MGSGLLKMTDFSCGLILPKISQQPARRLRIPAFSSQYVYPSASSIDHPTVSTCLSTVLAARWLPLTVGC